MKASFPMALFWIAAVFCSAQPAMALGSSEGQDRQLDLAGSLGTATAVIEDRDSSRLVGKDVAGDDFSQTTLRLVFSGALGERSFFEANLIQKFLMSATIDEADTSGVVWGAPTSRRYRISDGFWEWLEGDDFRGTLIIDRLNLKFSLSEIDVTAGRQAINFSQAYFWSPLDVFLPFDPEAFDREYKPGVDAIRVDVVLGDYSGLTLVGALGRELVLDGEEAEGTVSVLDFEDEPWFGSALMARANTNYLDWDFVFQGGKVYGGYQIGTGFSGEVFTFGVNGEAVYFFADEERTTTLPVIGETGITQREVDLFQDHAVLVLGLNHRFVNDVHFNLEYLYNGAGDADDLEASTARMSVGETVSLCEHLLGTQVSYDFHPLLSGQLAWIYSLSDSSSLISPTLTYSLSDEAEVVFGVIVGSGDQPTTRSIEIQPPTGAAQTIEVLELESEFGSYPNLYYGELKFYF